jgi:hypothetical protein
MTSGDEIAVAMTTATVKKRLIILNLMAASCRRTATDSAWSHRFIDLSWSKM